MFLTLGSESNDQLITRPQLGHYMVQNLESYAENLNPVSIINMKVAENRM